MLSRFTFSLARDVTLVVPVVNTLLAHSLSRVRIKYAALVRFSRIHALPRVLARLSHRRRTYVRRYGFPAGNIRRPGAPFVDLPVALMHDA